MPHHPAKDPRRAATDAETSLHQQLAAVTARRAAEGFAKATGARLGQTHKMLLGEHLLALMDGLGDAEAFAFVDRLMADLQDGRNG